MFPHLREVDMLVVLGCTRSAAERTRFCKSSRFSSTISGTRLQHLAEVAVVVKASAALSQKRASGAAFGARAAEPATADPRHAGVAPIIVRIGLWGSIYYKYNKEPPPKNSIGNWVPIEFKALSGERKLNV